MNSFTSNSSQHSLSTLLSLQGIKKDFFGVAALKGVGFNLKRGQGLGLVGENGAGKSTLMKVLSGVYPYGTYQGKIIFNGEECKFSSPKEAQQKGIAIIHQELNLFPELSVGENIFLSHFPLNSWNGISFSEITKRCEILLKRLEVRFDASTKVGHLDPGDQQMVEIAKALSQKAEILILDEPTSSLGQKEVEVLMQILKKLQQESLSFIYISHKLEEVFALCHSVCVLRDGESVFQGELQNMLPDELIEYMVGRKIEQLFPKHINPPVGLNEHPDKPLLEVKNWFAYKITEGKNRVKGVSFKAYAGEIVGIAGMVGAGRTDLILSLFGHEKYKTQGEVWLDGKPYHPPFSPIRSWESGFAYTSEDRKKTGLHIEHSVQDNFLLPWLRGEEGRGLLKKKKILGLVEKLVKQFQIKISSPLQPVKTLSGGNQQKIAIARCLPLSPRVLFLDEPTRGVDVGAKGEIYAILGQLAQEGVLIIMVSSELPEIIGLCHRVLVIKDGELKETLSGEEMTEVNIMKAALGVSK